MSHSGAPMFAAGHDESRRQVDVLRPQKTGPVASERTTEPAFQRRPPWEVRRAPGPPHRSRWMAAAAIVASGTLLTTAGCGGAGVSASDMRRFAIRRAPDVEAAPADQPPSDRPVEKPAPAVAPPAETLDARVATPPADAIEPADADASPASASPLSDTQSAPSTPLTPQQRAERSVANLERIAAALDRFVREKGHFPARATFHGQRDPLLSWRVELLPYLGYEALYAKFHRDEPWNSRHNYELLAHIPSVYQSPERFDEHTNYVVAVASNTPFGGHRVVPLSAFEDGVANTAIVVEVDDVAAVPWTAPRELELDIRAPTRNLGSLRDGGFLVIWGSRNVGRVPTTASPADLKAMFTHESGENFTAGRIDQPPHVRPAAALAAMGPPAAHIDDRKSGDRPHGGAPGAAGELHTLASDFRQRSAEAFADDRESDGLDWYFAAALVEPAGGAWVNDYGWVPALHRPTPRLRFGVGLQYAGPRDPQTLDRSTTPNQPAGKAVWSNVTGEVGSLLVQWLARHLAENAPQRAARAEAEPRRTRRQRPTGATLMPRQEQLLAPGIAFLGVGRESVLQKLAARQQVDILVSVDWRDSPRGWSMGLRLIDVRRDAELLRLPRLRQSALETASPLTDHPFVRAKSTIEQFLEAECTFQALPARLEPRHAARRLQMLAKQQDENPLAALAEMRYYAELGYVDSAQLLKAYQAKLGEDEGVHLLVGGADDRRQTLRPWLPAE